MTDNEAILIMDGATRDEHLYTYDPEDRPYLIAKAENVALDALKEIIKYRAIGTVEEFSAMTSDGFIHDALNVGYNNGLKDGYAKAIDEFLHNAEVKISEVILKHQGQLDFASGLSVANRMLDEVAEHMRGQVSE